MQITPITKTLACGVICELKIECKQTVLQSVLIPSSDILSHRVVKLASSLLVDD